MQICYLKIPTMIAEQLDEDNVYKKNRKLGCWVSSLNFRRSKNPVNSTKTDSIIIYCDCI